MRALDPIWRFTRKNHLALFFGGWFVLNLLQAGMTELFDDEAYYWAYSNYLAWGYFDHPPMIALMIKVGYFFFRNELGVRLLTVVLSTATLVVVRKLLPKKNDALFYAIACSMAALQIGGIMAVPDIPLLFFSAVFFLQYRRFIRNMSWQNALLLGLCMALMLYSKYHAVLVIGFTFLSYGQLFKKYQTYIAFSTALLLYAPHLYWEYHYQFPSLHFHMIDRNADGYDVMYTLKYFPEQVLFAGPVAGFPLLWAAFRYHPKDHFEKALKYTMTGVYIFFLFSSIKGRVEINWTIPALLPLFVLSHQYILENREAWRKWIFRFASATLFLVLIVRVYMIADLSSGIHIDKQDELHGNRAWAYSIRQKAGNSPVVFTDSYQYASKYWFYSGQPSFSLNTPYYHRNNYNFWPIENSIFNKTVYVVGDQNRFLLKDSIEAGRGLEGGRLITPYISFSGVEIRVPNPVRVAGGMARNVRLLVLVSDPLTKFTVKPPFNRLPVQMWIINDDRLEKIINTGLTMEQMTKKENPFMVSFAVDLPPGEYKARFAIPSAVPNAATVNSSLIRLRVLRPG